MDFKHIPSDKTEYYGGVKMMHLKTSLLLSNSSGKLAATGSEGTTFNFYAGYKFMNIENLTADIGTRLNTLKIP